MPGVLSKTEARYRLVALGLAPRGLELDLAAAYVGLSPALFLAEVDAGRYPRPTRHGGSSRKPGRRVWDVKALDDAMDALNGRVRSSLPSSSAPSDPIMEKIRASAQTQKAS